MAVTRKRPPRGVKADPGLYVLANAIRGVLRLDPIPHTTPDYRHVPDEQRGLARVYSWNSNPTGMTPRRGGAL